MRDLTQIPKVEAEPQLMTASNHGKIIAELETRRGPGAGRTVVAYGLEIVGDGQIEMPLHRRIYPCAELLPRQYSGRRGTFDRAALEAEVNGVDRRRIDGEGVANRARLHVVILTDADHLRHQEQVLAVKRRRYSMLRNEIPDEHRLFFIDRVIDFAHPLVFPVV